jgi:hypothetical protein
VLKQGMLKAKRKGYKLTSYPLDYLNKKIPQKLLAINQ